MDHEELDGANKSRLSFTGTAFEYFGIWIVNLFLSIVTIGIYTAWAKVRRLRYFYGHTTLDGHNFEYHARPIQILIGRIIVVAVLVLINVLSAITPLAGLLVIPYLFALPWIINKAIAFNARVTSYRNVRFNFVGTYWRSFWVFILLPIIAIFTLGILAPFASRAASNYIGSGLSFGTARFQTRANLGPLYGNLGMTILVTILIALIFSAIFYAFQASGLADGLLAMLGSFLPSEARDTPAAIFGIGFIFIFYIALIFSYIFYRAGVRNIAYNATIVDEKHRLGSDVNRLTMLWIALSNAMVVILTFGLMRPWAAVRSWRYKAVNSSLAIQGSLDYIVAEINKDGNVASQEFLDIEGFDFGF